MEEVRHDLKKVRRGLAERVKKQKWEQEFEPHQKEEGFQIDFMEETEEEEVLT